MYDEIEIHSSFIFRYYLVTFFSGLTFYISVLVPFYTQWGHLNLTQVQILQSWLMIWMFIFNIPTGVFADHFGRKISVALGSLTLAISCVLYFLIPGFFPFLIAEFLAALGTSFVIGANTSLIYDYLKQNNQENESKQILGKASAIGSLGTVVAAILGSIIAANFGIRMPMLFTAVPLLIAAFIILTIHEPSRYEKTSRPNPFETIKKGVGFFLTNKNLKFLVFNDLLVWIGAYFLVWLYQPTLIKAGLVIVYFGLIRSVFSLAGMVATFNIHLTEKLFGSEKRFVNTTALIVSACLILIAIFPSVVTVVIAIIFIGGFASARTSYLNTVMNEYIPAEQRATVLSSTSTVNMLIFAIANPIVGYVADHSLRLAFLGVGLLPLIAFFFFRYKSKSKKINGNIVGKEMNQQE
jgi:MFS family permease